MSLTLAKPMNEKEKNCSTLQIFLSGYQDIKYKQADKKLASKGETVYMHDMMIVEKIGLSSYQECIYSMATMNCTNLLAVAGNTLCDMKPIIITISFRLDNSYYMSMSDVLIWYIYIM